MVTPLSSSTEVQHEQVIDTSADRFQTYPPSGEPRIVNIAYAVFTQIQSCSAQIFGSVCDFWQKTATKIQSIFHAFVGMISGSTNVSVDPKELQVDQERKKGIEEVDQKIQNLEPFAKL